MADSSATDKEVDKPSCSFFKKSKRKGNVRKRKAESSGSEGEKESAVVRVERKTAPNPLVQRTGTAKRMFDMKPKERKESNDDDDEEQSGAVNKDVNFSFKSTRSAMSSGPQDAGATSINEVDTERDRDAQAIFERKLAVNKEVYNKEKEDDKLYHGVNNYKAYFEKKDTAQGNAASGNVRHGPMRAPDNIRVTTRWDYQPDICKDYKETGFCGFGDSCKFLHDRSDYKHGWQLEREYDAGNYDKQDPHQYEVNSDSDDDLPFACYICREPFKNPVVTKCRHYFCESCALAHFKKSKRCYVCNQATQGVFNPAKDIIKKLEEGKPDGVAGQDD